MIRWTVTLVVLMPQLISPQLVGSTFPAAQPHGFPMPSNAKRGTPIDSNSFKQNPNIPCGLPPFVDKLPLELQERLRFVWGGYKDGDECGAQQAQTFDIVRSLSDQDRVSIFGQPPVTQKTSTPLPTVPDLMPMFIRTSSPETMQKFDAIWTNETIDLDERYNKMEELANQLLNAQQLADFKNWIGAMRTQKAQLDARISTLSVEAREALREIKTLRAKEQKILQSLSQAAVNQLVGLF